jgi:NodT family efflux transporter outer membrane factor (OMF) lipoprotein
MKKISLILSVCILLPLAGCKVGPDYKRPAAVLAPAFKEDPPASFKETPATNSANGWKPVQPSDAQLKGAWWTIFGDAKLNQLEPQVDTANQTLKSAEANFRAARAQIQYARSYKAPTVGVAPGAGAVRNSAHLPYFPESLADNGEGNFALPFDLDYEIDLWGRVRRTIALAREQAQASAADLENSRLSLHAELAVDYFNMRAADAQLRLLDETIKAYRSALQLTEDRHDGGASPLSDVVEARTQLQEAEVQATNVAIQRAACEHAIAVLIGKPPAALTLPPAPITVAAPAIPAIPGVLPSDLLERRPDIAAKERTMAAANERIGIAQTAYYPTLSLSGAAGFAGTSMVNWFSWPSRFFAVGGTLSQTLFDHGRRRATSGVALAQYDETIADYRQTTLSAFQQVEDNLNALRNLEIEAGQQRAATASARQSLDLFDARYRGGVDTYLQVITWQTALLRDERNDIEITRRRFESSVLLVKALGGGWSASQLPAQP